MDHINDTQKTLLVGAAAFLAGGLAFYSYNKVAQPVLPEPKPESVVDLQKVSNSSLDIFIRFLREAK